MWPPGGGGGIWPTFGTTDIQKDIFSAELFKRHSTELFCFVILCSILAVFSNFYWKTLPNRSIFRNVISTSLLLNGNLAKINVN